MQGCAEKQVLGSVAAGGARWRRALRRELTALLLLKFAALGLLWWLFFAPAHRSPVDAHATSRQFGVAPRTAQPATGQTPLNLRKRP
jgi:hypothetical protein